MGLNYFNGRYWWNCLFANIFIHSLQVAIPNLKECNLSLLKTGFLSYNIENYPDSKVHGANMGPNWGWQDPGGPHVDHVNLAIWVHLARLRKECFKLQYLAIS